jgi:hypothetical protein
LNGYKKGSGILETKVKKKKNPFLIGCGTIIGAIAVGLMLILVIGGISQSNDTVVKENDITPILNVEEFSLVNQALVKEQLGEPKSAETVNFQTPSTGMNNVLTYLEYDWEGYYSEFIFDDKDRLIRINIYPSDNQESKLVKTNFEDHLKQLGIIPGDSISKVEDTGYAWRYQYVTDKIDEIWTMGDDGESFDVIKISFDVRPFL